MRNPRLPALAALAVLAVLATVIVTPTRTTAQPVDHTAVTNARKDLADATAALKQAQTALDATKAKLLETTPEWAAALDAKKQAQAALDAATAPVLEQVRNGKEYKDAAQAKAKAQEKLQELKASQTATADQY